MPDAPDMKPRSRDVTDGLEKTAARGMLRAVGMGDDDWVKPQIGVASSWNEITMREAVMYWIAQVVGGIVAAALLKLMVSGFGGATDETGALGTNEYGKTVSLGGAMVVEVVMTCLLVLVVLLVTSRAAAPGFAGLAIGLVLTVIHLVGIPLDGTSVNPARSIGPALFNGGTPLSQLWVFIVFPLVGGAIAALVAPLFETAVPESDVDPTGATVPET